MWELYLVELSNLREKIILNLFKYTENVARINLKYYTKIS